MTRKAKNKKRKPKPHYSSGPPQTIRAHLPHLDTKYGRWRSPDGLPKRRMEMYLGWLIAAGISDTDAQCMMGDLYWDCCTEMALALAARYSPI